eukprot:SAG11_NODE_1489_length_4814_cov_2.132131_1_plen_272_part_00
MDRFESLDYHSGKLSGSMLTRRQLDADKRLMLCGVSVGTVGRWVLAVAVGVLTGTCALTLGKCIEGLVDWKIERLKRQIKYDELQYDGSAAGKLMEDAEVESAEADSVLLFRSPLLDFVNVNLVMALLAALPTVLWVSEAAGSGIPEVMGYLNGVHIPQFLQLRTLAAKLWGTTLIVASGVAVGPEGPLVHAGAIIGSGLTRGRSCVTVPPEQRGTPRRHDDGSGGRAEEGGWLWWLRRWQGMFHNDLDRRDFISMGAAAVSLVTDIGPWS